MGLQVKYNYAEGVGYFSPWFQYQFLQFLQSTHYAEGVR